MQQPRIVWLRRDLRLADHPALYAAAAAGPVVPVYVLDDETPGERKMGAASRWWLHHSLASLARALGRHDSRLILRKGDAVRELAQIAKETGVAEVHAIRHYEPWWRKAQDKLGWMHNRVRMIAASFLVKHLLVDWREGERWFWDCLVDADYGNNGVNWQWISGTGVDSNMFTRIMAPIGQSAKFDAAAYIREWVPELSHLSDEQIHDPDDAHRPKGYPPKIIGHKEARERALAAYREAKSHG